MNHQNKPDPLPIEVQPWRTRGPDMAGSQWIYRFDNGYGASVVQGPHSYGGAEGLYELGVLEFDGDSHQLTYATPITEDVIGWNSVEDIAALLVAIAALPARDGARVNAEAHDAHLSRLPEDDVPVSGRSQPRPAPVPAEQHLMTVVGETNGQVRVICTCHEDGRLWSRTFEPYHTVDDLTELKRQHCGEPPAVPSPLGVRLCADSAGGLVCELPAGHYAHHNQRTGSHSISWPAADEPVFGTESSPGTSS